MKKGILLLIIFCFTKISFAQIGLFFSDFGKVGDSVILASDDNYIGVVYTGESGIELTWEFDFLEETNTDTLLFIDPSSTSGGNIANSNIVLRSNFVDTYWENNVHDLLVKAIGFEFDFSIIDSTDSVRTIYMQYPEGIHQTSYYMEFGNNFNLSTEGIFAYPIKDTFELDTTVGKIYVDSVKVVDNVTIKDSINGEGLLYLPLDSMDCLRQDINLVHKYSVEVKIKDPIFGLFMIWVPLSDFIQIPIPNMKEHYIRYWAKGQVYPVLEFSLDSNDKATSTKYLFNTREYIAGIKNINNSNISISPNPTNGFIVVNLENKIGNSTVVIYDILGNVVQSTYTSMKELKLDLSNNEKGIYFIEITSQNLEKDVLKIIKE